MSSNDARTGLKSKSKSKSNAESAASTGNTPLVARTVSLQPIAVTDADNEPYSYAKDIEERLTETHNKTEEIIKLLNAKYDELEKVKRELAQSMIDINSLKAENSAQIELTDELTREKQEAIQKSKELEIEIQEHKLRIVGLERDTSIKVAEADSIGQDITKYRAELNSILAKTKALQHIVLAVPLKRGGRSNKRSQRNNRRQSRKRQIRSFRHNY
jgi:DNA repair exonuclease SbcCD ATPase subunit